MHRSRTFAHSLTLATDAAVALLVAAAAVGCASGSDQVEDTGGVTPELDAGASNDAAAPPVDAAAPPVDAAAPPVDAATIDGAVLQASSPRQAIVKVPDDHRPTAPPWLPPVPLGAPGWQQSQTSYCVKRDADIAVGDVTADERGVYALFAGNCLGYLDEPNPPACRGSGTSLQMNDGTGWRTIYDTLDEAFALRLRVMPGGPVMLMGMIDAACRVALVAGDGTYRCLPGIGNPVDAAGVRADLGYLLDSNGDSTTVLALDGNSAVPLATLPLNARAIWADAQTVVVVGAQQGVYVREGEGSFSALPKVPAGNYESVWATGPDDLWMQNTAGQLVHYTGGTWTTIDTPAHQFVSDERLWGNGSTLYLSTGDSFGRWNGQTWETLLETTGNGTIEGMAARSSGEVFLAYHDPSFDLYACGGAFLLWFDGMQFHRF